MTKENLIELGLTETQAGQVMQSLSGAFVPKGRFNAVNTELQALKGVHKSTEAIAAELEAMQTQGAAMETAFNAELRRVKIAAAIDKALMQAHAHNPSTVTPLLGTFLENAELMPDGSVKGLSGEIKKLADSGETSFLFRTEHSGISGAAPAGSVTLAPDPKNMSYQAQLNHARQNCDNHAAILIKQAASRDGLTLI